MNPPPPTRLASWAQLVRLPTVFTVIADTSAAYLLVAGGPRPAAPAVLVVLAGVALYWAGMILNDVFDVQRDRRERPERPIPAGHIPRQHARRAGILLLLVGIALAAASGYARSGSAAWLPAAVAVVLAITIVLYDGPLKATLLAPAAMGACRFLSFTLGASAALVAGSDPLIPRYVLGIAAGFGVYIMGITTMARHEVAGGRSMTLVLGMVITILGISILAVAPQLNDQATAWHTDLHQTFPIMIALLGVPVILRAIRAVAIPTPVNIQQTIRVGIVSVIPLAAAFAFLGAGPTWGLLVFALAIPSSLLGARLRIT